MNFDESHRPWPTPASPWVMTMTWDELLFMHWPVPAEMLRPLVPAKLPLDFYDGKAWVGVVPFLMTNTRLRLTPALPWVSEFCELNVRTYVAVDGKPGVYFFSLDAASPLAVTTARAFFKLNYYNATMTMQTRNSTTTYRSTRTHADAPRAEFTATYGPTGPAKPAERGSLESFLTDRYCLYASDSSGKIYRGDIHHNPWPLQPATAQVSLNTMAYAAGVKLPDKQPLLHYSKHLEVVAWPIEQVG